jgi:hypothetical protein
MSKGTPNPDALAPGQRRALAAICRNPGIPCPKGYLADGEVIHPLSAMHLQSRGLAYVKLMGRLRSARLLPTPRGLAVNTALLALEAALAS